ncbi:MAG: hypothetical protein HY927_08205 [Elusimicrobia bacterium]|nr:hypothetical protein [Elusimicrobiota bacterium]
MTFLPAVLLVAVSCALAAPPGDAAPAPALERPPSFSVGGYVKELWQYSRSSIDHRPYFINVARQRLSLDAARSALVAHVDYDHEQLAGSMFRTQEYRRFGLAEPAAFLDAEQSISTSATAIWRHRLYRWWAGVETDGGVLRFGRQRIAWGTGKLFNPTDVLNPANPFSVEKEERPGVDALYGRLGLAELTQAELAWAPEEGWSRNALLARVRSNWRSFDLSAMGGKTSLSTSSWIVGGDFAGNVADGTLRGEWSYSDPGGGRPSWKLSVGYDYTFTTDVRIPGFKDLSVMAEFFHNGAGRTGVFRYDFRKVLAGREITLAKDYAGFAFAKDLHPLLKLDVTVVLNLDDSSWFAGPVLTWDVGRSLFVSGGFQRYGGSAPTEYGRLSNVGYLQAQFHF